MWSCTQPLKFEYLQLEFGSLFLLLEVRLIPPRMVTFFLTFCLGDSVNNIQKLGRTQSGGSQQCEAHHGSNSRSMMNCKREGTPVSYCSYKEHKEKQMRSIYIDMLPPCKTCGCYHVDVISIVIEARWRRIA